MHDEKVLPRAYDHNIISQGGNLGLSTAALRPSGQRPSAILLNLAFSSRVSLANVEPRVAFLHFSDQPWSILLGVSDRS